MYVIFWFILKLIFKLFNLNRFQPQFAKKIVIRHNGAIFRKCPKNKIIEIPLFRNVYLDYNAEDDFSRYLSKVEIKEHPFSRILKQKKGKILKKTRHPYLWKAQFIFSKVPKKGKLEVFWS